MAGPLSGLKIVEMAGLGPGPFAAMMLADHGAEVIRVERAGMIGVPNDPLLRNRRSISLDLKREECREVVRRLAGHADGLIEGYRPGVMERLGLGPDELLKANPKLVYGRVTGWGQDGPLAQEAGHDINYIAISGLLHGIGPKERPVVPINYLGDYAGGGMMLAFGMVAALLAVQRGGAGQVIDAAMSDGAALIGALTYGLRAAGLWRDEREANMLDGGEPWYGIYRCLDGKSLSIGAIEPQFQTSLFKGLALPPSAGREAIATVIASRTRDQWAAHFTGTDACVAPVLDLGEAPVHPHNMARRTFVDLAGVFQPAPAPRYSETSLDRPDPPRREGQDGEAILTELGYEADEIRAILESKLMHPLYEQMETSVFERMSLAAAKHGAVNLGQGFPDFGWPPEILDTAARAVIEGSNQYAPSRGLPALREAVAAHYLRHQGLDLTHENICITSGATEALAAAILATVEPGDEVIILTPAYDAYAPLIRRAGGVVLEVALQPPGWRIERNALEAAVGPKTRVIIFNNPHNPTGRLFDADELAAIAEIAVANDLIVISDEVWEHILLDGQQFTPIASLAGMAERTLKCGSAGKIFSLTGWKIGWLAASAKLATLAARAHQFLTFASAPNLQAAVAYGLNEGDAWLLPMRERFARARDRMTQGLEAAGYAVLPSASTYFLCVDLAASGIALDDEAFARLAVEEAGVAAVPLSPFAEQDPPRHLIRLCFAKRDETIDAGVAALAKAKELTK